MKTRKEIINEYKKMKTQMGVFQIRNTINNKIFIDCSVDMLSLWNRHMTELNLGSHHNLSLLNDWKKNGQENFCFEIITELKENDKENINYRKELKLLQEMIIEENQTVEYYN